MNKPPLDKNLTEQVRRVVAAAGGDGATTDDIYQALDIVGPKIKKKICNRLHDMMHKSNEIERIGRGRYRKKTGARAEKSLPVAQRIWNLLRIRHKRGQGVTTEDLVTVAGATNPYARERMRFFVRLGIVKKTGRSSWRMVTDPVRMPSDTGKIERLRRIRKDKRTAYLQSIDTMIAAGIDARMAAVDFNDALDAELAERSAAEKGGPNG